MNHLLKIDMSKLPKPSEMVFRDHGGVGVCLVVEMASIAEARQWAQALGITLKDSDPGCEYIYVRQEFGTVEHGPLRVMVIGTESTPDEDKDARRVIREATRAARQAVTS